MNATNAIDLTAVITTPENIQFDYRIAGPFRRLPALLVDFAIRVSAWVLIFIVVLLLGISLPFAFPVLLAFFLVFWFLVDWFYGMFFEAFWNGQTPGKYLMKLQVISIDGRPISMYQATVRNFLRLADIAPVVHLGMILPSMNNFWLPTFVVSLICMTITKRFQRFGDIAASTMVVVNERAWVPANVKLEDPRIAALSEYIPANFRMTSTMAKTIALYAERRARIPAGRRIELANYLAKPLIKRFRFREDTSSDLLLCALYYRDFVAKEAFADIANQRSTLGATPERMSPMDNSEPSPSPNVEPEILVAEVVTDSPPPILGSFDSSVTRNEPRDSLS